jgi:hypothetical protein
MEDTMKRRDFLKIGVSTIVAVPVVLNEAASPATAEPAAAASKIPAEPVPCRDWSVKFRSVTVSTMRDTYDIFFNDSQRSRTPEDYLGYLLSGTDLPRCQKVDAMKTDGSPDGVSVTLTGVVFASNTRQHPETRFAGYEHTGFCLSSPNSRSGMHLAFSERVV